MQYTTSYNCYPTTTPNTPLSLLTTSLYKKHETTYYPTSINIKSCHHYHKNASVSNCLVADSSHIPISANAKAITSTSNPFVKHCVKLRQSSSYRYSHGLVLVVGTTLIREINEFHVLQQEQETAIECLFLLDKAEVPEDMCDIPGDRVYVSSLVMKKLAGVHSTESIEAIALMRFPKYFLNLNDNQVEKDCKRWFCCASTHRILVLEGIQDPGNLGTLLRSALAFKWNGVFMLPGCCDPFNEKALRASRGAPFQLPIVSGNWAHFEAFRNEVQVKLLAGHPDSIDESRPVYKLSQGLTNSVSDKPLCLVLGSEGTGLSEKARQACELVSIPMADNFESLNVAVAGGIFMYMLQSERQENPLIDLRQKSLTK